MKKLSFIWLLLISFAFAQNGDNNWHLGLQMGLGHSYRTLHTNSLQTSTRDIDKQNELESPIIGLNSNLFLGFRIVHNLWIESGFSISRLGRLSSIESNRINILYREEHFLHYYYSDIPIILKYYTSPKKVKGFLFVGHEFNLVMFWRHKHRKYTNGQLATEIKVNWHSSDMEWLVRSIIGGGGVSYQLKERISIEASIFTKRNYTPIEDGGRIVTKAYYIAGNIGLIFQL